MQEVIHAERKEGDTITAQRSGNGWPEEKERDAEGSRERQRQTLRITEMDTYRKMETKNLAALLRAGRRGEGGRRNLLLEFHL